MNAVAMTVFKPRKEYWLRRESYQRFPVHKSAMLRTELWGLVVTGLDMIGIWTWDKVWPKYKELRLSLLYLIYKSIHSFSAFYGFECVALEIRNFCCLYEWIVNVSTIVYEQGEGKINQKDIFNPFPNDKF